MDSTDFLILFDFLKLFLKFVWLCLNYAAMHKFCACFDLKLCDMKTKLGMPSKTMILTNRKPICLSVWNDCRNLNWIPAILLQGYKDTLLCNSWLMRCNCCNCLEMVFMSPMVMHLVFHELSGVMSRLITIIASSSLVWWTE